MTVHNVHDRYVDQVDGEAHPGKGHPGWPREDSVDGAASTFDEAYSALPVCGQAIKTFDASQDDPGEGQGPGQPVEAAIDGTLG